MILCSTRMPPSGSLKGPLFERDRPPGAPPCQDIKHVARALQQRLQGHRKFEYQPSRTHVAASGQARERPTGATAPARFGTRARPHRGQHEGKAQGPCILALLCPLSEGLDQDLVVNLGNLGQESLTIDVAVTVRRAVLEKPQSNFGAANNKRLTDLPPAHGR